MNNRQIDTSVAAALSFFETYNAAAQEANTVRKTLTEIDAKLEALSLSGKPDFSKISSLHFEREHLNKRLARAEKIGVETEQCFVKHGEVLYHEANQMRELAGAAALECAKARLRDDFSGQTLENIARYHPMMFAEADRRCFVMSPREAGTFQVFIKSIPDTLEQIAKAKRRIEIYSECAAQHSLPSQKDLDSATPESAKPAPFKPRHELSDAEQAARDESLKSADRKRIEALVAKGKQIAGDFGENMGELMQFVSQNPEVAPYFPARRVAG